MRKLAVPTALFSFAFIAEAGLVTFFTFWPIRHDLRRVHSLLDFLSLYSVDSNLDVWVLTVVHLLALPLCFIRVAGLIRRHRRRYANARLAVRFICITCQVSSLCLRDWACSSPLSDQREAQRASFQSLGWGRCSRANADSSASHGSFMLY